MKTITLTPTDEFELRYLRDRMEREAEIEHRSDETNQRQNRLARGGRFTEKERDDRKAVEVLNRILS
jgi:hypothetical protein